MLRTQVEYQPRVGHVLRSPFYENQPHLPRVSECETLRKASAIGAPEIADHHHWRAHLNSSHADWTFAGSLAGARHGKVHQQRGETHSRVPG